jgi:CMP-N-acetylneuraminic acid synthetase
MLTINDEKRIKNYSDFASPTGNRQNFEELHIASGSVYVFSVNDFQNNNKKIPIVDSIPVIVTNAEIIDIDDTFDLRIAKLIGECSEF